MGLVYTKGDHESIRDMDYRHHQTVLQEQMELVGDVKGSDVIIIDDMVWFYLSVFQSRLMLG